MTAMRTVLVSGAAVLLLAGCASTPTSTSTPAQASMPLVTVATQPEDSAWWLRTEYHPSGRTVRGIDAQHYDPRWCAADEIMPRDFPEAATAGPRGLDDMIRLGGTHLSLSDDFGSAQRLEVFLGAYAQCDGQRGIFFAVLAPARGRGAGRIVQVERFGRGTFFSYLRPYRASGEPTGFLVVSCFACDDLGRRYIWDAAADKFILVPRPPQGPA